MKVLVFLFTIAMCNNAAAQRYGFSNYCEFNAKNEYVNFLHRELIRSTVRLEYVLNTNSGSPPSRYCTGTLLNVIGNQFPLENGTYIYSANHCLVDAPGANLNAPLRISVNYQSPGLNTESTPISNRGEVGQSTSFQDNRYQYYFESTYTVVHNTDEADFVLIKLNKPIPTHFRPYYAGWNACPYLNTFFIGQAFHHPMGDIKKIYSTTAYKTAWQINVACNWVANFVDGFCDFWGLDCGGWVDEYVCDHITVPFYVTGPISFGTVEHGSSGCGLITPLGQIVGNLHGGGDHCIPSENDNFYTRGINELAALFGLSIGFDVYGEFDRAFRYRDVFNALNPEGSVTASTAGILGRSITCYNNLQGLEGYYFPASDVGDDNHVEINSANDITAGGLDNNGNQKTLKVMSRADYTFNAGGM